MRAPPARRALPAGRPDRRRPWRRLDGAKRPLIILGGGALHAGAAALAIAEKLKAPILTTTAGKGAVPADHPLCLGYVHGPRRRVPTFSASAMPFSARARELSETDFWNDGGDREEPDPHRHRSRLARHGRIRPRSPSMGDAREALEAIAEGLSQRKGPGRGEIGKLRPTSCDTGIADENRRLGTPVLEVIRDALPPRNRHLLRHDADRLCGERDLPRLRSRAHGSIPWASARWASRCPPASAPSSASGTTPVAVMIGDYGLQYTHQRTGHRGGAQAAAGHSHVEQRSRWAQSATTW